MVYAFSHVVVTKKWPAEVEILAMVGASYVFENISA